MVRRAGDAIGDGRKHGPRNRGKAPSHPCARLRVAEQSSFSVIRSACSMCPIRAHPVFGSCGAVPRDARRVPGRKHDVRSCDPVRGQEL
eukprot:2161811-Rhodomonas_salina.1